MKRVALLVEPHFMSEHHGVRNYIGGLREILSRECRVDLISFFVGPGGRVQFYQLAPRDRDFFRDNGMCDDTCFKGRPSEVLEAYEGYRANQRRASLDDFYYSHIGADLSIQDYDLCIVTNPWMIEVDLPVAAKQMAGIVYDVIPNLYAINKDHKPFSWAAQHSRGFEYYLDRCDSIFCISPAVEEGFRTFFAKQDSRVVSLPPVMPASYANVAAAKDSRLRNVVLAAPLDPRKGVMQIPDILNMAADEIETLSIYGAVRCEPKHLKQFFEKVRANRIVWRPYASADIVHQLYHESKVLLFPSFEEGLGLPIIEAQFCGCRVMVRDRAPMNKLALAGSEFVSDDVERDGAALKSMIISDFAHTELQAVAQARFDSRFVREIIFRSLGWQPTEVLSLTNAA
jgi:glycosyltransferase involved in cell wall biosynthesis